MKSARVASILVARCFLGAAISSIDAPKFLVKKETETTSHVPWEADLVHDRDHFTQTTPPTTSDAPEEEEQPRAVEHKAESIAGDADRRYHGYWPHVDWPGVTMVATAKSSELHQDEHVEEHNIEHHENAHTTEQHQQEDSDHAHGDSEHAKEHHTDGHGHSDEAHGRAQDEHGQPGANWEDDHYEEEHGHDEDAHGHDEDTHGHDEHDHGHASHDHAHDEHGHETHGHDAHGHDDHGHDSHGHDDHGQDSHGHGAHGHGHGEGAKAVALCLVSGVFVIPVILYMSLKAGPIGNITLKLVDTFVSIFLAVLWFNFVRTAIEFTGAKYLFPFAEQIVELVYLAILYFAALFIAYELRHMKITMIIFCGMGAHFIAFAGISACGSTQGFVADEVPDIVGPATSFGVCLAVLATFVAVSVAMHVFFVGKVGHDEFLESIDDLEMDICGLVMSFIITQGVRHTIKGDYPAPAHLLFLETAGDTGPPPSLAVRLTMLGWAIFLTVATALVLPPLHSWEDLGYWHAKFVRGLKTVLIMCISWGYLLWGQWEFGSVFTGDPMFGQELFAVIATLVCVFIVIALAQLEVTTSKGRETKGVIITGVSLAAAWSWEHCFNTAFNIIGEEYQVGFGGLVPKGLLAILIPLFVFPVYLENVKPRVIEMEEQEKAEHGR